MIEKKDLKPEPEERSIFKGRPQEENVKNRFQMSGLRGKKSLLTTKCLF